MSSSASGSPSALRAVLVAAAITAAITGIRLYGEVQDWGPPLFAKVAGGAFSPFGIVWLIPIFGFWFGRRLAVSGKGPGRLGRAALLPLLGLLALMGSLMYVGSSYQGEELRTMMGYFGFLGPGLALLALFGWPAAFVTNLVYAVLARAPVVLVQYVAIGKAWGTHYESVHPSLPPMTPDERAHALMLAQALVWVPFTILAASLFSALGAMTVRARKQ